MNYQILGLLDGDYTTYLSVDSVETEDNSERLNFTIEFLNSINPSGIPQHRLRLKVGTVVMLLRDLNTKKGLCNGTKLDISSMRSNVIEAKTEDDGERLNFTIEFLNSINPSEMLQHRLRLKVGTVVMLLRNLNTKKGLCNGTKLVISSMRSNVIEAKVISESATTEVVFIPRIDLINSDTELPFKMSRRQFPVKMAFTMANNKSQGQTLGKVGFFLSEPVFGHGQLYVLFQGQAFGRCQNEGSEYPSTGRLLKNR
nr:unnamed protein product [Callosobruchus analis]